MLRWDIQKTRGLRDINDWSFNSPGYFQYILLTAPTTKSDVTVPSIAESRWNWDSKVGAVLGKTVRNFHNNDTYVFLQEAPNHTVIVAYIFLREKETLLPGFRAIWIPNKTNPIPAVIVTPVNRPLPLKLRYGMLIGSASRILNCNSPIIWPIVVRSLNYVGSWGPSIYARSWGMSYAISYGWYTFFS